MTRSKVLPEYRTWALLTLLASLGVATVLWIPGSLAAQDIESYLFPTPGEDSGPPVLLSADCEPTLPELAGLASGGFVAAWVDDLEQLRFRRLDRRGEPLGFERRPRPLADGVQGPYRVAASPDGGYAVVWAEPETLRFWRFDADGRIRRKPLSIPGPVPTRGLALAAEGGDSYVVAWFTGSTMHLARVDAESEVRRHDVTGVAGSARLRRVSAATDPDGVLWLLRQDVPRQAGGFISILTGLRIPFEDPDAFEVFFSRQGPTHRGAALTVDARNRVTVAWSDRDAAFVQRFDARGEALGEPLEVVREPDIEVELEGLDISGDGEGNVVVVWDRWVRPGGPDTLHARTLGADGSFLGSAAEVMVDRVFNVGEPRVVLTAPGEATVSWARFKGGFGSLDPTPCSENLILLAVRFPRAGPRTLLLGEGRFRIEVEWQDPVSGESGRGRAIPDTEESGGFWFFEPENTELRVKVIDGREVNGHFWFFYGALTHVGYRITVTDQRTGRVRTYENPFGRLASFADTEAFEALDELGKPE
jgi:hypothetical protein